MLSAQVLASGEGMYIHTDGLGSPVARSDVNGNYIAGSRTRYEPYGATAAGATPTIGFTGHVNDAATGLVYMQQRYYDPYAGRFLSTDPVLTDAKTGNFFNRYIYANNNPYKYIDRDGRIAETVWDVFNVGLGVASMANNLANGNYGSAALDVVGVVIDSAASAAPFIPGGVATVINTSRVASTAASGAGATAGISKAIPKPPTGKGSVAPGARDPKRSATTTERGKMLDERGGKCENCSKDLKNEDAKSHHIERHADGGATTPENTAIVCKDCHVEIHRPDPK